MGTSSTTGLNKLLSNLHASPAWQKLWFKDFRVEQILPFSGDALAYVSRLFGSLVVERLKVQALQRLSDFDPNRDRLHLVTHSWGTVILFDVLFAGRWDDHKIPTATREKVENIRQIIFGLCPHEDRGIKLASIHTMGSPVALFSLITLVGTEADPSGHDISVGLRQLLQQLQSQGIQIPWCNYIHPGDPIAWPLQGVIPDLLKEEQSVINAEDVLSQTSGFLNVVGRVFQGNFLSLVNGGNAHSSYWENERIAQRIAKTII